MRRVVLSSACPTCARGESRGAAGHVDLPDADRRLGVGNVDASVGEVELLPGELAKLSHTEPRQAERGDDLAARDLLVAGCLLLDVSGGLKKRLELIGFEEGPVRPGGFQPSAAPARGIRREPSVLDGVVEKSGESRSPPPPPSPVPRPRCRPAPRQHRRRPRRPRSCRDPRQLAHRPGFPRETMLADRRAAIEGLGMRLADGIALEAESGCPRSRSRAARRQPLCSRRRARRNRRRGLGRVPPWPTS